MTSEDWNAMQVKIPSHKNTFLYGRGLGGEGVDLDDSDEEIPIIDIVPDATPRVNAMPGTYLYAHEVRTAETVETDPSSDEEDIPVIEVPESPSKLDNIKDTYTYTPDTKTGTEAYSSPTVTWRSSGETSSRADSTPLYYYDEDLGFVDGYDSSDQMDKSYKTQKLPQSRPGQRKKDDYKKPGERAEVVNRRQKFHRGFNYVRARYPSQFHQDGNGTKSAKPAGGNFKLPASLRPSTRYGKEARVVNTKDRKDKKKKWPEPPVYPARERVRDASVECHILKMVEKMDIGSQATVLVTDTGVQCPLAMTNASTQYPRTKKKAMATQADTPKMVTQGTQNVAETKNAMVETCYRLVYATQNFVVTDDAGTQCELPSGERTTALTPPPMPTKPATNQVLPITIIEAPTDESYESGATSYQSDTLSATEDGTTYEADDTSDEQAGENCPVGMEDDTTLPDELRYSRLSMETSPGDIMPRVSDPGSPRKDFALHLAVPDDELDEGRLETESTRSDDVAVLALDTDRSDVESAHLTLPTPANGAYSDDSDWEDTPRLTGRTGVVNDNGTHGQADLDDLDSVSVAIREDAHSD